LVVVVNATLPTTFIRIGRIIGGQTGAIQINGTLIAVFSPFVRRPSKGIPEVGEILVESGQHRHNRSTINQGIGIRPPTEGPPSRSNGTHHIGIIVQNLCWLFQCRKLILEIVVQGWVVFGPGIRMTGSQAGVSDGEVQQARGSTAAGIDIGTGVGATVDIGQALQHDGFTRSLEATGAGPAKLAVCGTVHTQHERIAHFQVDIRTVDGIATVDAVIARHRRRFTRAVLHTIGFPLDNTSSCPTAHVQADLFGHHPHGQFIVRIQCQTDAVEQDPVDTVPILHIGSRRLGNTGCRHSGVVNPPIDGGRQNKVGIVPFILHPVVFSVIAFPIPVAIGSGGRFDIGGCGGNAIIKGGQFFPA